MAFDIDLGNGGSGFDISLSPTQQSTKGNILISSSFKDISDINVNVSGAWKTVNAAYQIVSGAWKTIFTTSGPSCTFSINNYIGSSQQQYLTGSNYYIGAYGIGAPASVFNVYLDITCPAVQGPISNLKITFLDMVKSTAFTDQPIRVYGITDSTRSTTVMSLLHTTSNITISGGKFEFTISGTNLENWFNGTNYNGICLDSYPNYYAYWWGYSGIEVTPS